MVARMLKAKGRANSIPNILKKLPIDFIIKNKISYLFYEKTRFIFESRQEKEKKLELIYNKHEQVKCLIEEVYNLSNLFKNNNIDFAIFKTIRVPQCDITDIDIIVRREQLNKVKTLLCQHGYINCQPWGSAERNFVKSNKNTIGIILDIHTEEEFENEHTFRIKNILDDIIWEDGIYKLSPETDLLVSISHLIWHNIALSHHHSILLSDILYLSSLLENCNLNVILDRIQKEWFYILFFHYIYIVNVIYESIYNEDIKSTIVEHAKSLHNQSKILKLLSRIETRVIKLPLYSRTFRIFCFLYKLFYDIKRFDFKEISRTISAAILYPILSNIRLIISSLERKRVIVCLAGIDGSGKTSHAIKIVKRFKSMGIPCQYVWCNWVPKISYPIMGLIYLIRGYRRKDYHKSKILKRVWNYIVILDFLWIYFFKVRIPLLMGKNVICDRYVYDAIADLMYDGLYNEKATRILLKFTPKPDLVFILDLPEDISYSRKNDTRNAVNIKDSDEPIEYLKIHRENYLKIAESLNIPILDATKKFEELHEEIYRQILYTYLNKQRRKDNLKEQ